MSGVSQGPDALIGKVVGGYRLDRVIGMGATGAVYFGVAVEDSAASGPGDSAGDTTRVRAAVKVLSIPWQLSESQAADFRLRFRREIETLKQMSHPRILPVHASGQDPATGHLFMAMPYVDQSLADRLHAEGGRLPLSETERIATQVADALDYAHDKGIVHRDVKPANILIDGHGNVYLTDFGILRLLDTSRTKLTATGGVVGTPAYMAPEQALGDSVGPTADVYSLAAVAYELVTGRPPFGGDAPASVMLRQVNEAPLSPRQLRPDLPEAAESALLIGLSKQPGARFQSASAFARAFSAGLQGIWPPTPVVTPTPFQMAQTVATGTSAAQPQPLPWSPYPETPILPSEAAHRRWTSGWTPVFIAALLLAVGAIIGILLVPGANPAKTQAGQKAPISTTAANATTTRPKPSFTTSPPRVRALVPAGMLIYESGAPGACDSQGARWTQNNVAVQTCSSGALVMSDADCDCPIGVVALVDVGGHGYPTNFVVQVRATQVGKAPTAKFGFKFRQQSADDSGQGRGGYSFLVDPNGQWQFNEYDGDGTRHVLDQQQLGFAVHGDNTLDVSVRGAAYSFYFNGQLITTETDSTYLNGYLCLAVEPASTVYFHDFALYQAD